MSLIDAVAFLKGAVGKTTTGGAPSVYTFHEGVAYARGPAISLAAYPVPHILGTFAMASDDVEGALGRMDAEPTIGAGDGTIILRVGRRRSSIDLLPADVPDGLVDPDPTWSVPPDGLFDALRAALPFVDSAGSWNRGIRLDKDRVVAMSGRSAIEIDLPGLAPDGQASLSDDVVEYLIKLKEQPDRWLLDQSSASFSWSSGAWVKCQLVAIPWPKGIFEKAMALVPDDGTGVAITDEFRDAFDYVASLGDGNVAIGPDGMVGRSAHAEHRDEGAIDMAEESTWTIKALKPVVEVADRWSPRNDPAGGWRARFEGKNLRGIVVGQKR